MSFSQKPKSCLGCSAYEWGMGFLPPQGPPESPLVLLGTGPTESQAWNSGPLVLERMEHWLGEAGIPPREILIGNLVQCWLPLRRNPTPDGTREPTQAEIKFCWKAHILPILDKLAPLSRRVLVPVGLPATRWILGLGEGSTEKYIGTIQEVELPE